VIEILIKIVSVIVLMSLAFAIGFGLWHLVEIPLRRWRESAFDYVDVDLNAPAIGKEAETET
jgi:peptidoglycan/LPS O-acetylase OafA/YrhL